MTLTLNQVLGIILTVAAVVAVTFLVMFLNQLRKTAREGEKTLVKAQETMDGLKVIEAKMNASLDNVGEVLAVSKKAVSGLSEITYLPHVQGHQAVGEVLAVPVPAGPPRPATAEKKKGEEGWVTRKTAISGIPC